jgi:hypothetical protein
MTNENKLTLNERKQKMEIRDGENNKRENDIEKKIGGLRDRKCNILLHVDHIPTDHLIIRPSYWPIHFGA